MRSQDRILQSKIRCCGQSFSHNTVTTEAGNLYWVGEEGGVKNRYTYNGKELVDDLDIDLHDYSARQYDPAIGRWTSVDPAAEEHAPLSPFVYVGNMPIRAIDPDGKRFFFVGGANNDQDGWNYIQRWGNAVTHGGIQNFVRVNASTGKVGDVNFTNTHRHSGTFGPSWSPRTNHTTVDMAYNQITQNLRDNPLEDGEQLNLAGYSFGSVAQAQAALRLADEGTFVDELNVIQATGNVIHYDNVISSDFFNNGDLQLDYHARDITNERLEAFVFVNQIFELEINCEQTTFIDFPPIIAEPSDPHFPIDKIGMKEELDSINGGGGTGGPHPDLPFEQEEWDFFLPYILNEVLTFIVSIKKPELPEQSY